MESSQRNGEALRKRINIQANTLVQSFENLLAEAMITDGPREGRTDLLASMDRGLQTDLAAQTMVHIPT
jgi:hypothetical protein